MSVRVVARIRPLLKAEIEKDIIVHAEKTASATDKDSATIVRIPNPKNHGENFSFNFNSVYDQSATQAHIFDNEVSSTVKHLFKGFDVTIFAYGVTGTGKTHTMRGGKSLAERGVIPRLLSGIYRRARKAEKDSSGESTVEVSMSYFEIYNDKVFDLFEPPEKRTPAGLPIRDNQQGKAVVVGLTERPCTSLKEFEGLYDHANINRSTSATKLNAHSSRSHAILCVKISQTTGDQTRVSTVSAIDLAGSEDNRRTDNNKERLVESAAINKSLFVLAQCVEAISKGQARIPYRESKMTRILSLGQNKAHTVMVLNIAPVKSYHLDTLSSLNFANRTKKIETNEIENQPFYRDIPGKSKLDGPAMTSIAPTSALNRQPLRPKILSHNANIKDATVPIAKPTKQFSVYSDKPVRPSNQANTSHPRTTTRPSIRSPKRPSTDALPTLARPAKIPRTTATLKPTPGMSALDIEALIERKVTEALAERADTTSISNPEPMSDEVQKRLEALEKRVEGQETEQSEGLQYLLMAKQHQVRGEEASALKMYMLAQPYFQGNEKLERKIEGLRHRIEGRKKEEVETRRSPAKAVTTRTRDSPMKPAAAAAAKDFDADSSYHAAPSLHAASDSDSDSDTPVPRRPLTRIRRRPHGPTRSITAPSPAIHTLFDTEDPLIRDLCSPTPRTTRLLDIINTRDVAQIRLLKGVGAKRAEAIVGALCDMEIGEEDGGRGVVSLVELGRLRGVGAKLVQGMRGGCVEGVS
ncbi:hypothetical protein B0A48_05617 [Cryoendolithus antarcticus]|uniref:Kinesin motor domain-containing protein n=1 Tax=Cryoendolithus antarcticus TaxID=1507870 RepID=A0A1V8TJD8_9PEZI|nr:hypothetical protein B0A48_05617 [Cryoendolithus antarcticus]